MGDIMPPPNAANPRPSSTRGVCYETGQVVPQDYAEAFKWYKAAAEQEVAPAQCNLGLCYQTGRGCEQNDTEAVKWFCRAAKQGDKTAQHNLGLYYATQEIKAAEAAEAGDSGRSRSFSRSFLSCFVPVWRATNLLGLQVRFQTEQCPAGFPRSNNSSSPLPGSRPRPSTLED